MNFLFYFIKFYYRLTFKYLCFSCVCLFITLFYFYKQIDYYFLTKITDLTSIVVFKYINVFDIFICNFKINFAILLFCIIPIIYSYFLLDQSICFMVKNITIIKSHFVYCNFFYSLFIIVYIKYICLLFFKILLSYQIKINNNFKNEFFLSFDLYLANYVDFWCLLFTLLFCIILFNFLHCIFCYNNNFYYYYNKIFFFICLVLLFIIICNSLVVDIYAFCLFYIYYFIISLILFYLYLIFIYTYLNYK